MAVVSGAVRGASASRLGYGRVTGSIATQPRGRSARGAYGGRGVMAGSRAAVLPPVAVAAQRIIFSIERVTQFVLSRMMLFASHTERHMSSRKFVRHLSIAMVIATAAVAGQEPPAVTISGTKDTGAAIYRYILSNQGSKAIVAVVLGDSPPSGDCSLNVAPLDWTPGVAVPPTSAVSPIGWKIEAFAQEDTGKMCVAWRAHATEQSHDLEPGTLTPGFMIVARIEDAAYLSAPVKIIFSDGTTVQTVVR